MILFTPMKVNKDDFEVKEIHHELEIREPSLKKKIQSYNVKITNDTHLDLEDSGRRIKHGLTDPMLVSNHKFLQ